MQGAAEPNALEGERPTLKDWDGAIPNPLSYMFIYTYMSIYMFARTV